MQKIILPITLIIMLSMAGFILLKSGRNNPMQNTLTTLTQNSIQTVTHQDTPVNTPTLASSPTPSPIPLPTEKILQNDYHIFQSFNNCGPAALSMALSYYNINIGQQELGQALRPYQVPGGDNDDKSVTLEELAEKSKEYGLTPYHRPNGNIELIQKFIANGIPVITRTWLEPNEDIGHYRVVKGYNLETQQIIQDDSLQGKNLNYSNDEFNTIWQKFNYEYLVLVPKEKEEMAKNILGEDLDPKTAWQKAVENSKTALASNPDSIYDRFNLSVAYYNTGDFQNAVTEFEKVENSLSFRTLWYQIEPIHAYYELQNYDRVFAITDRIINYHNRAFSELYIIRGNIYKQQGQTDLARAEYEKAIFYNQNLQEAKDAINTL